MKNKKIIIITASCVLFLIIISIIYTIVSKKPATEGGSNATPVTSTPGPATVLTRAPANSASPHPNREVRFAAAVEQIERSYPWLNRLPLQTSTYFVYFDVPTRTFIAKLYVDPKAQDATKAEITAKLKSLNIALDTFPIVYTVYGTPQQ